MKTFNYITKKNWKTFFDNGELLASFDHVDGDGMMFVLTLRDEPIAMIEPHDLSEYIKDNESDLWADLSTRDTDLKEWVIENDAYDGLDLIELFNVEMLMDLYFEEVNV